MPGVHRDLRDRRSKRLAMSGGLRRHVVPLAVALATAILLVVPGASAAPPPGPDPRVVAPAADDDPVLVGAGDVADCRRSADTRTAELIDGIAGHVFAAGDLAYPTGQRPAVPRLLRPDLGPLPLEDVAGHRQPRVRDRRRTRLLRLLRRHRPAPGARAGTPTTSARGGSTSSTPTATIVRCGPQFGAGALAAGGPRGASPRVRRGDLAPPAVLVRRARQQRRWSRRAVGAAGGRRRGPRGQRPRPRLRAVRAPDRRRGPVRRRHPRVRRGDRRRAAARRSGGSPRTASSRSAAAHGVLKLTLGAGGYTWAFVPVPARPTRTPAPPPATDGAARISGGGAGPRRGCRRSTARRGPAARAGGPRAGTSPRGSPR